MWTLEPLHPLTTYLCRPLGPSHLPVPLLDPFLHPVPCLLPGPRRRLLGLPFLHHG